LKQDFSLDLDLRDELATLEQRRGQILLKRPKFAVRREFYRTEPTLTMYSNAWQQHLQIMYIILNVKSDRGSPPQMHVTRVARFFSEQQFTKTGKKHTN
jgi:hypothetical protein